ncbi:FxLYD domain-containing protein [Streptomyces melanogenes]|uniref:FxLYD domain-containing protein n=1 Tax=Streptomyces melanogenes TaxID=67326 RepID=UPI00167CF288|nr:FxLYD domain-containing protein [Streptomyces melanogenes]
MISTAAVGCGNDDASPPKPSGAASVASAAVSAAGKVQQGLESAASAMASASAAAESEMAKIRNGIDAKADVRAESPETGSDGLTTARLTVVNSTAERHDYTVQVNFKDKNGNVLDTVLLSVKDVGAGESKPATARSTHPLTGASVAEVANAVRH